MTWTRWSMNRTQQENFLHQRTYIVVQCLFQTPGRTSSDFEGEETLKIKNILCQVEFHSASVKSGERYRQQSASNVPRLLWEPIMCPIEKFKAWQHKEFTAASVQVCHSFFLSFLFPCHQHPSIFSGPIWQWRRVALYSIHAGTSTAVHGLKEEETTKIINLFVFHVFLNKLIGSCHLTQQFTQNKRSA